MKHTILHLFMLALFICVLEACSSSKKAKGNKELSGRLKSHPIRTTAKRLQTAQMIYNRQRDCAHSSTLTPIPCNTDAVTTDSCGIGKPYCYDQCIRKIMYCHEICEDEFEDLTLDENQNYECSRPFKKSQFYSVMNAEYCDSFAVRCYIYDNGDRTYYRIARASTREAHGDPYETFYSVALLKGILEYHAPREIISIRLFRGTQVSDGGHAVNLIPIKVTFKEGSPKYYDLSNDFP